MCAPERLPRCQWHRETVTPPKGVTEARRPLHGANGAMAPDRGRTHVRVHASRVHVRTTKIHTTAPTAVVCTCQPKRSLQRSDHTPRTTTAPAVVCAPPRAHAYACACVRAHVVRVMRAQRAR